MPRALHTSVLPLLAPPVGRRVQLRCLGLAGADNPLCGLAEDEYCAALADGKRPLFIGQARSEEEVLATECWHIEAARRPQLSEVEHRLASLC